MRLTSGPPLNITVNGEVHDTTVTTVGALAMELMHQQETMIAEVNGTVIPQEFYEKTPIRDGDIIELRLLSRAE